MSVVISVIGYGSAAISLPEVRPLLLTAIGASILSGALTIIIVPTYITLLTLRGAVHRRRSEYIHQVSEQRLDTGDILADTTMEHYNEVELLNETEQEVARTTISKWGRLHRLRALINSAGWIAGFAATILV
ncbi:hypothetical protein DL93DRAFT_2075744 [Clavulina sp. PMI_390]|nr:hypothetical protein DL93DRAFT_2075744 [Clavulina sp. PMI_390]